jgi:hypothetical protein
MRTLGSVFSLWLPVALALVGSCVVILSFLKSSFRGMILATLMCLCCEQFVFCTEDTGSNAWVFWHGLLC